MKKIMERISLLSLSLMLISSFSITAGLPAMKAYFSQFGYSAGQVELLVSLPAFAVVAMLFLNSLGIDHSCPQPKDQTTQKDEMIVLHNQRQEATS